MFRICFSGFLLLSAAACSRMENVGKAPDFSKSVGTDAYYAMTTSTMPEDVQPHDALGEASLWSRERDSLLGDRRAERRGDILTVVIEIDDEAEISNSTGRSRNGSESMAIPDFLGIPQRIGSQLPDGADMDNAVSTNSSSGYSGEGSVSRNERLTLRVAATVTRVLPNGVLQIQGSQEVRVNFELRELLVSGFVQPQDISRRNEISYDKIAAARISYGGRGQISDVQQPRYGQQVADIILPF